MSRPFAYLITCMLLLTTTAAAVDSGPQMLNPELQGRYEEIISQVRCATCQNQTIKDSNAFLAADLRRQVREMLDEGASDAEIYEFLRLRYGDFVLYRPPVNSKTALLWVAPILFLLFGMIIVMRIVRRRIKIPSEYTGDPVEHESK